MKINVPEFAKAHFWVEPPAGSWEFWGFRFKPKCQIGDKITFLIDKREVAEAIVAKIEPPGQSECSSSGRFKSTWKVYWIPESFRDLRHKVRAIHSPETNVKSCCACPDCAADRLKRGG